MAFDMYPTGRCLVTLILLCVSAPAAAQVRDRPLQDGDRILLKIWTDTIFADTLRVQSNGRVVLPRIGDLNVQRLPPRDIPDSVRHAYTSLLRTATVEVTPLRRVTVLGEVQKPSIYFLEPEASLRDAVALAGGVTEIGVSGHVTVVRGAGRTKVADWQRRTGDDAAVQSGDIVIVDRESWFKRNAFTVVSAAGVLLSIVLSLSR